MLRPAQFSNLDSALMLAMTIAWLAAFVNLAAGNAITAWAEVALVILYIAVYLTREVRRWRWELR